VRRARFRLLVATARRHAKQRKAHLLAKDLEALDALSEAREGFRPALVEALRWLEAAVRGDVVAADARAKLVAERLGSEAGAAYFLHTLAGASGSPRPTIPPGCPDDIVRALGRASLLAAEAKLTIEVPLRLDGRLEKLLGGNAVGAEPTELLALGDALLSKRRQALAYAVSGAGLRLGGPSTARFLLQRARSLPDFSRTRRRDACAAAAELARRLRDPDLVKAAVDVARSHDRRGYGGGEDARDSVLEPAELERIIDRERREREVPRGPTPEDLERCTCPACRNSFGFGADFDDDDEGDDDFEDGEPLDLDSLDLDALGPLPPGMTPEVAKVVIEVIKKHARPDGSLPDMQKVERKDPELMRRLIEAVMKSGGSSPFGPGRRRP
jgi:hypothetical protein